MDTNTLVALLGGAAIGGLTVFGSVCVYMGIDSFVIAGVSGSLGAVIGAAATYIRTRG